MVDIVITAFYHFKDLPNFEELKEPTLEFCKSCGLKGTILLAKEGVNSTISGSREGIDKLYAYLRDEIGIKDLVYKESYHETQPFGKMKVSLKKEIVALGVENLDVEGLKGEYIPADKWDDFISREDVVLIDTRNKYETRIGTFERALDPRTDNFRQFPQWVEDKLKDVSKEQNIAMFCTGGIRCEKSTAYLKKAGFKNVFHLEGGILKYFEDTEAKKWHGSCFVFDDRVALDKKLHAATDLHCGNCDKELGTDDLRRSILAEQNICIQCGNHG